MAFATSIRSPNSWVRSFRYGRLAAPRAGARELEQRLEHLRALDRVGPHVARGRVGGIDQEEVEVRSLGARGARPSAPCRSPCASRPPCCAPDTRRRRRRTRCSRRARPGSSSTGPGARGRCHSLCLNVVGRVGRRRSARTPSCGSRVCGQTSAHLAQSMQIAGSQIGISLRDRALLPPRRVGREGPVDRAAPRPAAGRRCPRASWRSRAGRSRGPRRAPAAADADRRPRRDGTANLVQAVERGVHRREVLLHDGLARACRRSSRSRP